MSDSARTALILGVLGALLVVGGVWGWQATTEPLPAKVDRPVCVDIEVQAGERLYPQQVTVSVYNASSRAGLAGRTMRALRDRGFAQGRTGNVADARVGVAQIWTTDPESPAVRLVASHLGRKNVEIERRDGLGYGVTVVVGDRFDDLAADRRSVPVAADTTVCGPSVE